MADSTADERRRIKNELDQLDARDRAALHTISNFEQREAAILAKIAEEEKTLAMLRQHHKDAPFTLSDGEKRRRVLKKRLAVIENGKVRKLLEIQRMLKKLEETDEAATHRDD